MPLEDKRRKRVEGEHWKKMVQTVTWVETIDNKDIIYERWFIHLLDIE